MLYNNINFKTSSMTSGLLHVSAQLYKCYLHKCYIGYQMVITDNKNLRENFILNLALIFC